MLTLLMWREVQPMGVCSVTIACAWANMPSLYLSRRKASTLIGAVEVLGAFDLAAGPHV